MRNDVYTHIKGDQGREEVLLGLWV